MSELVVSGATLQCTFGLAPCTLTVEPKGQPTNAEHMLAANVADHLPSNIASFGMCTSLQNPQVQAATAAAQGVLTPMPCVPVISGNWTGGSPSVNVNGIPALVSTAQCQCAWSGVITILSPGQVSVEA